MRVAVFARKSIKFKEKSFLKFITKLVNDFKYEVLVYYKLKDLIKEELRISYFYDKGIPEYVNYIFSVGGDGTFLDTINFLTKKDIPIVGINFGRLGFLACLSHKETDKIPELLSKNKIKFEKRSVLKIDSTIFNPNKSIYALNDFYITKRSTNTMIETEVFVDGEFLNKYRADGLIISTPTGSTGYSMSCGGPIVHYKSRSLLITPVSPHNLNVRPVIVTDDSCLKIIVKEGRVKKINVSFDANSLIAKGQCVFIVKKAPFKIMVGQLQEETFYEKLKNKLYWGFDNRA